MKPTKIVDVVYRFVPTEKLFKSKMTIIYQCDDGKEYIAEQLKELGISTEQGET